MNAVSAPAGVAAGGPLGFLCVADGGNDRIQRFNEPGPPGD